MRNPSLKRAWEGMKLFSKQDLFCQICGNRMEIEIASAPYDARVCSPDCWSEFTWRKTLSIMGEPYREISAKSEDDDAG